MSRAKASSGSSTDQRTKARGHEKRSGVDARKLRANAGAPAHDFEPFADMTCSRDIVGVVLAVFAVASLIAVVTPSSAPITHALASFYHLGFGLGAYVLPIVLLLCSAGLFLRDRLPFDVRTVAGAAIIFISIIAMLSLSVSGTELSADAMFTPDNLARSGGYLGAWVASFLQGAFGKVISYVILIGVGITGLIVVGFSVSSFIQGTAQRAHDFMEHRRVDVNEAPWGDEAAARPAPAFSLLRHRGQGFATESEADSAETTFLGNDKTTVLPFDDDEDIDEDPFVDISDQIEAESAHTTLVPSVSTKVSRKKPTRQTRPQSSNRDVDDAQDSDADASDAASARQVAIPGFLAAAAQSAQVAPSVSVEGSGDDSLSDEHEVSVPKTAAAASGDLALAQTKNDGCVDGGDEGLKLPPTSMLRHNPHSASAASSEKELEQTAQALQSTLAEFGRSARVVGWISGPTVTTFKLQPGEGERVSKISSLEDDIALSLAAQSVRIFAPIPGTSLVGIEIPNAKRQNVNLGDVLPYVQGGPLELAIGRDAEGQPVVADLAKMPHLLIAGTTGSGKSVMINSIIMALLMRTLPEDVRLIMVDPKRVELSGYNGLPHLYVPVVTEPKQAASALQWAVSEMERRLKVFERIGVRKISTFNEKQARGEFEHYDNPPQKMPYLVIIIDELSDLMMVAGKDVEASIVRIAQLGRAAGIHLIVATQRPSSNVVTGLIKANITNRIAFNVATGIDSRVIIDQTGAEKLTGYGDMLFSKVDWGKPKRIQGCFVSDEEINSVVEFVKDQSEPDYHEEILSAVSPASLPGGGGGGFYNEPTDDDPLLWDAAQIVVDSQLGSTSGLQRRLKVGYARAGRIMDMLEEKGIVGPPDGSKPREVLLDAEGLEALRQVESELDAEDRLGGL